MSVLHSLKSNNVILTIKLKPHNSEHKSIIITKIFILIIIMLPEEYQIQDIYEYKRRSYKKRCRDQQDEIDNSKAPVHINTSDTSPKSDVRINACAFDSPGCSCNIDPEGDIANILHKKCPVISLAQQQLQRLLNEVEDQVSENVRSYGPVYNFLFTCQDLILKGNMCQYGLASLVVAAFVMGLLIGAASCGSYLGKFNSPLLSCIDNYFISDKYSNIQNTYLSIT
ncbi:hypothetical protein ACJJTC_011192 [Scirpophaga incertulas]